MRHAAYAAGFFHNLNGVAYASDPFAELVPVDTVSALIIAAAAAAVSSSGGNSSSSSISTSAVVYHASSTCSHSARVPDVFEMGKLFWTANPPAYRLPFAR